MQWNYDSLSVKKVFSQCSFTFLFPRAYNKIPNCQSSYSSLQSLLDFSTGESSKTTLQFWTEWYSVPQRRHQAVDLLCGFSFVLCKCSGIFKPGLLRFKIQLGVFLSVTCDTEGAPIACVLHLIKQSDEQDQPRRTKVTQQSFPSNK